MGDERGPPSHDHGAVLGLLEQQQRQRMDPAVVPDGTFKLTSVTNSALNIEHAIRIPHKGHNIFRKFVTLASLKVPSGGDSKNLTTGNGTIAAHLSVGSVLSASGPELARSFSPFPFFKFSMTFMKPRTGSNNNSLLCIKFFAVKLCFSD